MSNEIETIRRAKMKTYNLISTAIDNIILDLEDGDLTAIEILLSAVPVEDLEAYIREDDNEDI